MALAFFRMSCNLVTMTLAHRDLLAQRLDDFRRNIRVQGPKGRGQVKYRAARCAFRARLFGGLLFETSKIRIAIFHSASWAIHFVVCHLTCPRGEDPRGEDPVGETSRDPVAS
jgi:hypothetical protein